MELLFALEHDRLRRERVFKDRLDPLAVNDEHLIRYYRFPRNEIVTLCEELGPVIARQTNRCFAIPVATQVLVALRFYASGTFQSVVGDSTGISQSSVSRIITRVTSALHTLARRSIRMPNNREELLRTKQQFYSVAEFPNVIGVIDCTHIPIKAPQPEHVYLNRKRIHSLNVQVIADAQMLILSYSAKFPGSVHDSFIWNDCTLRQRFLEKEFGHSYMLGDSAYRLEPFLMTPLSEARTQQERHYNRSHARTRVLIEQTFGVLKSRFRCLHKSGGALQYRPLKCAQMAAACMYLHNLCIRRRIPFDGIVLENDDQPEDDPLEAPVGMPERIAERERSLLIRGSF